MTVFAVDDRVVVSLLAGTFEVRTGRAAAGRWFADRAIAIAIVS